MSFGAGKVILFGEHAVVFGEPAVAAALGVGIGVKSVVAADVHQYSAPLWATTTVRADGTRQGESLDRILRVIEERVGSPEPASLTLDIGVPVGAGLGSSAALAVCVARAFLDRCSVELSSDDRRAVVLAAAAASESVFHGAASGVDHTTSVLGGVLRYRRDAEPAFEPIEGVPPLRLVVAQMEAGADTRAMVESVASLRARQPDLAGGLLSLLGDMANASVSALQAGDLEALGELMNLAHGALASLGVSTAALDAGCHAARAAGALGAKLTGAGGGGCLIALPRQGAADLLAKHLAEAGALHVLTTGIGSP